MGGFPILLSKALVKELEGNISSKFHFVIL